MDVIFPILSDMFDAQVSIRILILIIAYMVMLVPIVVIMIHHMMQVKTIRATSNGIAALCER